MKELSIEQKAQRYDEAIEIAKEINNEHRAQPFNVMTRVFHELKESEVDEEERIKKVISDILLIDSDEIREILEANNLLMLDIDTWLEKQSKQNSADKVNPKFKVGDWVVSPNGVYYHIDAIRNGRYEVTTNTGNCCNWPLDTNIYRLWTIQDAKTGDVLCTYECNKPKIVFILKGTSKKHYALSYHCYYNIMSPCFESDSEKGCLAPNDEDVKPATKEQRDALMKAMTCAGYTFDFEKKVLKRKNETAEKLIALAECLEMEGDCLFNGLSGEDYGKFLRALANELSEVKPDMWSEEDDQYLLVCKNALAKYQTSDKWDSRIISSWLEEKLKAAQEHWKPSDLQIEALEYIVPKSCTYSEYIDCLKELIKQLKQL